MTVKRIQYSSILLKSQNMKNLNYNTLKTSKNVAF